MVGSANRSACHPGHTSVVTDAMLRGTVEPRVGRVDDAPVLKETSLEATSSKTLSESTNGFPVGSGMLDADVLGESV